MSIKWSEINQKMFLYSKGAFEENGLHFTKEEIMSAIKLYHSLCQYQSGYGLLDGVSKIMSQHLQNTCVEQIGQFPPLMSLATSLESYLKRIIIILGIKTYRDLEAERPCLLALYKYLSTYLPILTHHDTTNITSLKSRNDGSYILAVTREIRNDVHNTPEWDDSIITYRVKYVIATYVLITLRCKEEILKKLPELAENKQIRFIKNEDKRLYDFFTYGKTAKKIKGQMIESFIIHYVYEKTRVEKQQLTKEVQAYSMNSLNESTIMRIFNRMCKDDVLDLRDINYITLTEKERERVSDVINDYDWNLQYLQQDIEKILEKYSVKEKIEIYMDSLYDFFEKNYTFFYKNHEEDNLENIKDRLNELTAPLEVGEKQSMEILTETFNICKSNDVLIRTIASKAISRLTDPEQFASNIREVKHDVYLDTQVLLYAFIYFSDEFAHYDNRQYETIRDLLDYARQSKMIQFKTSMDYVDEVIHHLRKALQLIQFDSNPLLKGKKLSNNVFYSHYFFLLENDGLPQDVESFGDYMAVMFNLGEDDVFDSDFKNIARSQLLPRLQDMFIVVEDLQVDEAGKDTCRKILDNVIFINKLHEKANLVAENDSRMGAYLFTIGDLISEPFFITWDYSFSYFRQAYKEKYGRDYGHTMWKLFSPSQFLGYVDLINFKVNPSAITNELLSIMSNDEYIQNSKTLIDQWSKFLDISACQRGQRRKLIEWFAALENNSEFNYEELEKEDSETLLDILPKYLKEKECPFVLLKNMLMNENSAQHFFTLAKTYKHADTDEKKKNCLQEVDKLLEEFDKIQ